MKIDNAYARLRAERLTSEYQYPPTPILPWRDINHIGVMRNGACLRCFGVADDPRHWESALADGSYAASYPLRATVFRGSVGVE